MNWEQKRLSKFPLAAYFILNLLTVLFVKANSQNLYPLVNYDLALKIKSINFQPDSNFFSITAIITNLGTKAASNFTIQLNQDTDLDSSVSKNDELIWHESYKDSLKYKDSIVVTIKWKTIIPGYQRLIFNVDFSPDTKITNNIALIDIFIPYPKNTIIINEIMYNPLPGKAEYIEIYNNNSTSINLYGWKITDQTLPSGNRNTIRIEKNLYIKPNGYLTISSDSSIYQSFPYLKDTMYMVYCADKSSLNLNNDMDDVVLLDFNDIGIDSLRYYSEWQNPNVDNTDGIALERISTNINSNYKNNWSSCADKKGGTPSKQNSIFSILKNSESSSIITIEPNPFSPDFDGFEDFTIIRYNLSVKFAKLRVRIYDSKGRHIRTLVNNEYTTDKGEIIWDGLDNEKHRSKVGIYIILFEALDNSNGIVEVKKVPVVIATKL